MASELFLDTAFAIALASPTDQLHARALAVGQQIETARSRLVTTQAVVLEIGNALAKLRYRSAAVRLLQSLRNDPNVLVETVTDTLVSRAFQLYESRGDKEWGMTDCISFLVMQDRSITAALTSDEHFEQAGFLALLRPPRGKSFPPPSAS
jgi:predicted nucleic acid-binding protein